MHIHTNGLQSKSAGHFSFEPTIIDRADDEEKNDKQVFFRIGVNSFPYLADHGFHNMVVLPGAAYIQMAVLAHSEIYHKTASVLKNVSFENPIILTEEDTVVEVKVGLDPDGSVTCRFYEEGLEPSVYAAERKFSAEVKIDSEIAVETNRLFEEFSIDRFQGQAATLIDSEGFYKKLHTNGNQYGPSFQNLSKIWLSGDEALGAYSLSEIFDNDSLYFMHPTLLDSITQLVSVFVLENGKTFILKSIDEIVIFDSDVKGSIWAHAALSNIDENSSGFSGKIRVFDDSGNTHLVISGISYVLMDNSVADAEDVVNICIASTFTAEPVEDSLKFWGDYFEQAINIQFAPYNQVFQQLLDYETLFRKNDDGMNIILLGLEDWARKGKPVSVKVTRERLENLFKDKDRYVLPNNLEIVHLNKYETDYVYKEIFDDRCYLRHGITLKDDDTVIDIGANIGLFSLFVNRCCENPRVFAYEPSPVVHELLKANCEAYGSNVRTFNCGVSDREKNAEFTFYEKSSVFSSFYSDEKEDKEAIRAVVRNMLKSETAIEASAMEEYVEELTAGRLYSKIYSVRLISISDIIRENRLEKIDLLKIDAEKSELDILKGIQENDWAKIGQIVIEIHDKTGKILGQIEAILSQRGFIFKIEQEKLLEESGLYNIYAVRGPLERASNGGDSVDTTIKYALQRNISEFCDALESFMQATSLPMLVGVCPRTPKVKNDGGSDTFFDRAETMLLAGVEKISNVYAIDSQTFLNRYPLDSYFDPEGNRLGHIPYTTDFYASLGTSLYRTLFILKNKPFKVIVLDCDNTLWKGVCGEDGPFGIEVSEPYRRLQEFVIKKMDSGMLICLCSKNSESDVFEVFEKRDDMPLRLEHLVSWQINWNMKSENIKLLADELNLGLDSFVFIDDNPVECADVKINCPQVLTLQLPKDEERIPEFLKNIWSLDHIKTTAEDKKRTRMYKENVQREKYRDQALSLKDFLGGLRLNIRISSPTEEQMDRVSQLTYRTNQFNLTTIRRPKHEIKRLIEQENYECLVAHVSDRFGDYGLVSVLLYEDKGEFYSLDTFLLSCRVLGRGVEHQILATVGKRALEEGKKFIEIKYVPTEKNLPAFNFINSFGKKFREKTDKSSIYRIPTVILSNLAYVPITNSEVKPEKNRNKQKSLKSHKQDTGQLNMTEKLHHIGGELTDIRSISKAIEIFRYDTQETDAGEFIVTNNDLQKRILNIWQTVLGKKKIKLTDNFFEVGGTSLKAVQLFAAIKKELGAQLSIVTLFEFPTISSLSHRIKDGINLNKQRTEKSAAIARGVKRKKKRQKNRIKL